jgi:hypothetical protein
MTKKPAKKTAEDDVKEVLDAFVAAEKKPSKRVRDMLAQHSGLASASVDRLYEEIFAAQSDGAHPDEPVGPMIG